MPAPPLDAPLPTTGDLMRALRAQLPMLRSRFGVRRIGLFGSFARAEARQESDVDVLIEFEAGEATYDHLYDLHQFLRELFGRNVDVVTSGGLSTYAHPHIERDVLWA